MTECTPWTCRSASMKLVQLSVSKGSEWLECHKQTCKTKDQVQQAFVMTCSYCRSGGHQESYCGHGLKSFVRTRDSHLFLKVSRTALPAQAPDPSLQSRTVRATVPTVNRRLNSPRPKTVPVCLHGSLHCLAVWVPVSVGQLECPPLS